MILLAFDVIYIYIYFTAVGLTPGGSSTSHIYTQTVHSTQNTKLHALCHYFTS
jgi:hypothetical protein